MAEPEPPGRQLTRAEKAEVNRTTWATRELPPSSRALTGMLSRAEMSALRREAWRLRHVASPPFSLPPDFAMSTEVAEMLGLPPGPADKIEPTDDE
jgi:hypothetical protein